MKTYSIEEKKRIEKIITSCKLCFVGMADKEGKPYVLPMNFGFDNETIYLHSAQEGRAIRILEHNPRLCITFCTEPNLIYQHPDVACSYRMQSESVLCEGTVEFIEDFDEKVSALHTIMRQYTDKTFEYSKPAVVNVKVWKVHIDTFSAKEFGVRHPNSKAYKDGSTF